MPTFKILNLGAGVQSTTIYLMSIKQEEPDDIPLFDYAIFADTQDEPKAVYDHLEWMRSLDGPPILTGTVGRLGDDLARGMNSTGQRFASIPAFTSDVEGGEEGRTRRQCTKEYKVDVVERVIRREVLGMNKGQRIPSDVRVVQYFGLSFDEPRRRSRTTERFYGVKWSEPRFPLFDLFMTRSECKTWLAQQDIPHEVPRSACVFCPFKSNSEWRHLRDTDPEGWARAVEVDDALRIPGNVVNRGPNQKLYVHRSCFPLSQANIDTPDKPNNQGRFSFSGIGVAEEECEGMCGV